MEIYDYRNIITYVFDAVNHRFAASYKTSRDFKFEDSWEVGLRDFQELNKNNKKRA